MDINKRTILWIVFSISLALLWDSWMVSNGNPSFFNPTAQPAKVAQAPAANLPASPTMPTCFTPPLRSQRSQACLVLLKRACRTGPGQDRSHHHHDRCVQG
ncbi:hypothetical protein LP420_22580 [Massilia sp. B-10]|nr:hypothetical protein LP420_22580 [Massilia sp. B-10]